MEMEERAVYEWKKMLKKRKDTENTVDECTAQDIWIRKMRCQRDRKVGKQWK